MELASPEETHRKGHIVFTYSNYGRDSVTAKLIEDYNLEGSMVKAEFVDISDCKTNHDRMQRVTVAYKNDKSGIMILALPDRTSWKYVEQIKFHLESLSSYEENRKKKVVLIAHLGEKDFATGKFKSMPVSTGISFLSDDWQMHCIDDLVACDHEIFFEKMNSTLSEIVRSEDEQSLEFLKKCIMDSFEQLYTPLVIDETVQRVYDDLKEYIENSESI